MISCRIFGFRNQFSHLNSINILPIYPLNLAWGLISVGNTGWRDYFQNSIPDMPRVIALGFEILSYTRLTRKGELRTSRTYRRLVDADLQTATYRLGVALTSCIARKTIKVHWLQHVKCLIDAGVVELSPGTEEIPDYLGLDKFGGWHSIESKGRSNPPGNLVLQAKHQANRIMFVESSPPITCCGSVSHLYSIPIHVEFCDPEQDKDSNTKYDIRIDREKFIQKYYAPFVNLVNEKAIFHRQAIETNIGSLGYMIAYSTKNGIRYDNKIRYGLYVETYELIQGERLTSYNVTRISESLEEIEVKDPRIILGADGTLLMYETLY